MEPAEEPPSLAATFPQRAQVSDLPPELGLKPEEVVVVLGGLWWPRRGCGELYLSVQPPG